MRQQWMSPKNRQGGLVLVAALLSLVLVSLLSLTLLGLAGIDANLAFNSLQHDQAFYAAEAGLESALVDLRGVLATTSSPSDDQLGAIGPRPLSNPNLHFDTLQVQRVRSTPPYTYATVINQGAYKGLAAQTTDYRIVAQATGPRGARARMTQVVQYLQVPLFQFGVFYGGGVDLEIAPGPLMTFNGRVHANSNLFVVANSGLQFNSYITTAGTICRCLKRDSTLVRYNNPQIMDAGGTYQTLNFDHFYGSNFANAWSASSWQAASLSTFGSLVQDSAMGVQQIVPPIPGLFYNPSNPDVVSHEMIERGQASDSSALQQNKLFYQASLRIVDGVATDQAGNSVSLPSGVITTQTFYDMREQAQMTITQVNVGALRASGKAPANGLLYVSQAGTHQGVRLVNGSQLPGGGLSVASENPVYIQGDYNTVNKVPAAVFGDAVTVLSNNWGANNSDAKGNQTTSNRPASNTTVNAALALGPSAESVVGQGNGQLENVVRFLENWSGTTLTYQGSIIALWHSLQATGAWRCCGDSGNNYYNPPNRNWSYDTLFNTSLPPGTPSAVMIAKGSWVDG